MIDLNDLGPDELFEALGADACLARAVAAARDEDLADGGDRTTASIVDPAARNVAAVAARASGIVCGMRCLEAIVAGFPSGAPIRIDHLVADGAPCARGEILARISGPRDAILGIERTLLNVVARLSGIATLTGQFVEAVSGTTAVICDTRKTTPGLRALEKYAVRCGGGTLHRIGLWDALLFKDNHLEGIPLEELGPAVRAAVERGRRGGDLRFVEVEVDRLEQLDVLLALPAGTVDFVLLDNFSPDGLAEAVARRDAADSSIRLEASGGVTLASVRRIAESGVERISVGALTHSAAGLDIGLDLNGR